MTHIISTDILLASKSHDRDVNLRCAWKTTHSLTFCDPDNNSPDLENPIQYFPFQIEKLTDRADVIERKDVGALALNKFSFHYIVNLLSSEMGIPRYQYLANKLAKKLCK